LDRKCNLDSVDFDKIRQLIREAYKRGGVNTISWHLNNPEGGNAWQKGTVTAVRSILPNGVNNKKYQLWMDKLANYMLSLKDDNGKLIPIIFRPFHEHTGSWFWWGKNECTKDEYISLWKYTVNYLQSTKNVHNILYTYSPNITSSIEDLFERYPGDECLDIVGLDCYQFANQKAEVFMNNLNTSLKAITQEAKARGKIAALCETGFSQIPQSDWWTKVLWETISKYPLAYVLVWRNAVEKPDHYYAPYPGQISANDFVKLEKEKRTLFQKDIKNMYR
jgi:mannan endo-1,4-beta-mannosidase